MADYALIKQHNARVLAELQEGDMIEFPRGMYSHWGVYVGYEKVIHLSGGDNDGINANMSASSNLFTICGKRFNKAFVCEDNFWNVVLGSKATKNNGKDRKLTPLSAQDIVRKAKAMLGEIGYNALWHNCEHFAAFCRYGKKWSEQADTFFKGVTVLGALAVVGGMAWAYLRGDKEERREKSKDRKSSH